MKQCELCGKETDKLFKVIIANTELNVCHNCKKLGTLKEETQKSGSRKYFTKNNKRKFKKTLSTEEITLEEIVSLIQKELAKRSLNIKQLARQVNIKDSTLNKMLNRKIEIDIQTAKKLEHFLNIKLTRKVKKGSKDETEDLFFENTRKREVGQSLGDIIKDLRLKK